MKIKIIKYEFVVDGKKIVFYETFGITWQQLKILAKEYTSLKTKRLKTAIRGVVFGVFLCFVAFTGVNAGVNLFEDGFENYNTGEIVGQGYWLGVQGTYSWHVGTTTVSSGGQALQHDGSAFGNGAFKDLTGVATTSSPTGSIKFDFWIGSEREYNAIWFYAQYDNEKTTPERFNNAVFILSTQYEIKLTYGSASTTVAVSVPKDTWNEIEIEYDLQNNKARAILTGSDWSDYITIRDVPYLVGYHFEGSYEVAVDNIIWGEGTGYWDPVCDYGLFCNLCDTLETCEYYNCFWQNNYCWQTLPATTTDWNTYYETHSSFTTTTAFISFLTGFISPFLENIENWLTSFTEFFEKDNAIYYGIKMGGAVPTARGYLSVFNSFFGDFPISEIFIFFLTAMIVFVVYKQIRNLINLIKP